MKKTEIGAITSKTYAYLGRPWEIKKTESIDVMDSFGSNIRIDSRDNWILRIQPRYATNLNKEWVTDRIRFCLDGLRRQRIETPFVLGQNNTLLPCEWRQAFTSISEGLALASIRGVCGNLIDVETQVVFRNMLGQLGSSWVHGNQVAYNTDTDFLPAYLTKEHRFNNRSIVVFVGAGSNIEFPVYSLKTSVEVSEAGAKTISMGPYEEAFLRTQQASNSMHRLREVAEGKSGLCQLFSLDMSPVFVLGQSVFLKNDSDFLEFALRNISVFSGHTPGSLSFLHETASSVAASVLGLEVSAEGAPHAMYLLGADDFDVLPHAFTIYQGHHGDIGSSLANVILPSVTFTEKQGTYMTTYGMAQTTKPAVFSVGLAKPDWLLLFALSDYLYLGSKTRGSLKELAPRLFAQKFGHVPETVPVRHSQAGVYAVSVNEKSFGIQAPLHGVSRGRYLSNTITRHSRFLLSKLVLV